MTSTPDVQQCPASLDWWKKRAANASIKVAEVGLEAVMGYVKSEHFKCSPAEQQAIYNEAIQVAYERESMENVDEDPGRVLSCPEEVPGTQLRQREAPGTRTIYIWNIQMHCRRH